MKARKLLLVAVIGVLLAASGASYANVDWIAWSGGWSASTLVTGDYVSVTDTPSSPGTAYAAKPSNGVDWVVYSGGWISSPLYSGTTYKDLSGKVAATDGTMFGVNATGGIDWINYFGGWVSSPLVSGNYVSVATKSADDNSCYAARADGGIDWIRWSGTWGTESLGLTTKYVDIAPDANRYGFIWGARADGGIDYISWSGTWQVASIVSGNYISVCAASNGNGAYGARAGGGIDWITYSGGWQAQTILATGTVYSDIAMDTRGNGFLHGATAPVPEPSALASLGAGLIGLIGVVRRRR